VRHEAIAHRAQGNRPFALGDHDARQRRLAGLGNGFPQHGIDVLAGVAIGHEIIGGVYRRGVDELLDRHHRGTLDLDAVEIIVAQVFALSELVTLDE
jgi:hypothetical protein